MQAKVKEKVFVKTRNDKGTTNGKTNAVKAPKVMKSLIIIDKQYDFDNPEGALYVPGAENTNAPIIEYVKKHRHQINQIIWTADAHTKKDQSFKDFGGQWPVHCVDGTPGAALNKELYDTLSKMGIPMVIVKKGTVEDHEEYGAFEKCATFHHLYPNDTPKVKNCYFRNYEGTSGCRIINDNIVICGIAGDFCVKESIKNLLKHWRFNIEVLMGGIASIDGGTVLNELIDEKHLTKI